MIWLKFCRDNPQWIFCGANNANIFFIKVWNNVCICWFKNNPCSSSNSCILQNNVKLILINWRLTLFFYPSLKMNMTELKKDSTSNASYRNKVAIYWNSTVAASPWKLNDKQNLMPKDQFAIFETNPVDLTRDNWSAWALLCRIIFGTWALVNIHQDDVDDNKVIKKKYIKNLQYRLIRTFCLCRPTCRCTT